MSETLQERVMKAVFAEIKAAGYRIVKPHDYRPESGWPFSQTARVKCANCGAFEDGLASGLGCEVI